MIAAFNTLFNPLEGVETMADENQPARTVWLNRAGFRDSGDPRKPDVLYVVQRTRNTIAPRVLDQLDERAIEALLDAGVTVNIG